MSKKHATKEEALAAARASKRKWYHANKDNPEVKKYNKEYNKRRAQEIRTGTRKVKHKKNSAPGLEKKRKANRDWFNKFYAKKIKEQHKKTIDEYNKKYG